MNTGKKSISMSEQAAKQIIEFITSNQMLPGDRMPTETDLMERLEVSRSTIREAIKILSAWNILEIRQGSGASISPKRGIPDDPLGLTFIYDDDRLAIDLLDVRTMLEPRTAMLAAMNATAIQCENLKRQCKIVENLISQKQPYEEEDIQLHKLISEASGNKILINLSYILHMSVKKTIIATSDALRDSNTFIYHRKTIDAIINKDPVSAYNSMMVHVCGLREFIAGKISEKK